MLGLGMFSWFSYNLPLNERLQLIKEVGFDATCLWWHGDKKHEQPDIARKIGLQIDNIHTPFNKPNRLWQEGIDGEDYKDSIISCIEDCKIHDISTAVIHLTSFSENISVTDIGLIRVEKMINIAEQKCIKLAFENISTLEHLNTIFTQFKSPYVGFCYDSGHENWKHPNQDCLKMYGDRLFALHINDNFGDGDTHVLPFDGTVNWEEKMNKLKQCKSIDYFTLEVDFNREHEKSIIYNNLSAKEYLQLAYKKTNKLLNMK